MTHLFNAVDSEYLADTNGGFRLDDCPHRAGQVLSEKAAKKKLAKLVDKIAKQQRKLYAQNNFSVLLVFQAMDAAGKDSTIRNVLSGVNPAGCQVFSFKKPSSTELDHDFLWRSTLALPQRGRIGVFNRSQYEEVLVVRVHPSILDYQQLPFVPDAETLWSQRLESIADQELHLARNGTVIIKFFLNVSHEEQRQRFLARLEEPEKRWKFEPGDVRERGYWDKYMHAYQAAIAATSKPWAPLYAIPADDKPTMRCIVADVLLRSLESLNLAFPATGAADRKVHDTLYEQLKSGEQ